MVQIFHCKLEFCARLCSEAQLTLKFKNQLPDNILTIARTNSQKELAEIYTAADVFVNPTYEDTYPTVNLEARACGTRIICYDTCGCKETLGQIDVLVPKGQVDLLYNMIVKSKEG